MNRRIRLSRTTTLAAALLGLGALPFSQQASAAAIPQVELPERVGSAFHWADFDGDGRQDAFVVAPNLEGRLLRSLEGGALEDVTEVSGLASGDAVRFAVWEDYDLDGRLDLFVGAQAGPGWLYRGLEGGLFEEVAQAAGLTHAGTVLHAAFVDYDGDGRPDLHVHVQGDELLYHNEGRGFFQPVDLDLPAAPVRIGTPRGREALREDQVEDRIGGPSEPARSRTPRASEGIGEALRTVPIEQRAPSGTQEAVAFPLCAKAIDDQSGGCLFASSTPTLGKLYPLSSDLYVHAANGWVGLGTTSPTARLDVAGTVAATALDVTGAATVGYLAMNGPIDVVSNAGMDLFETGGLRYATLDRVASGGGELVLYDDANQVRVQLDNDFSGAGRLRLYGDAGLPDISLDTGTDGGIATIRAADGSSTVVIEGDSFGGGGNVSVRNDTSESTVDLSGDVVNSGALYLYDRNGANNFSSLVLRALDATQTGASLTLSDANSVVVSLDGDSGSGNPRFTLFEGDGSRMYELVNSNLTLFNAAGVATIGYNRETGTKNAIVGTSSGRRRLYSMESPEVWFEDFGRGQLVAGRARIDLEPIFLETVTTDAENPISVFITPTAPLLSHWVEQEGDHFVVHDLDGSSSATFNWRVVAKRKGSEGVRLPILDESDSNADGDGATHAPRRAVDRPAVTDEER